MQQLVPIITLTRGCILLSLAISYMIYSLFSIPLDFFLVALVVLAFLISWPWMAPFPKIMSVLLLLLGNVLFFLNGGNGTYWVHAILDNVALVSLFITVPLLSYPLRNGGYIEYTDHFITRYLNKDMKKVAFVTALTCIVSSFLNLGSIRVIYDLFSERFGHSSNYANMLHFGEGSANIQRILIANDALGWKNANRHHIKRRFSLNSDLVLS